MVHRFTLSTFEKAKRAEAYRRLARAVTGQEGTAGLLDLDEVRDRLQLFDQHYVGIEPIPVARIVGTAERTEDFDEDFLPRRAEIRDRWRDIEQTFPEGAYPPIIVYRVGTSYFVVDGHHRVAVAKRTGVEMVDAEVTELRTAVPLDESIDVPWLIRAEQRRLFMQQSGLAESRPDADIEVRRPHEYVELLELVKLHGYHLMRDRGEILPVEEIGAHWYDNVFLPTVDAIRGGRDGGLFPRASDADLFLWVWRRRRRLHPYERGTELWDAARQAVEEMARKPSARMRRAARKVLPRKDQRE